MVQMEIQHNFYFLDFFCDKLFQDSFSTFAKSSDLPHKYRCMFVLNCVQPLLAHDKNYYVR